jgi:hypothetical protein
MESSYLLSSELEEWKKYCSQFRIKPKEFNEQDVEQIRAEKKYQSLLEKDDDSLNNIPAGGFVVVHPTNGVVCSGSWEDVARRDEEHEYVFPHKQGPEHFFVCKLANSTPIA